MPDVKHLNRSRRRTKQNASRSASAESMPLQRPNIAIGGMDRIMLYVTIALSILGLVAVFSASAPEAMDTYGNALYYFQRQIVFFILGFSLMIGISKIPYFYWSRWAKPIAFVVIGLLMYTLLNGVESYGAERWIRVFGFQFQPSELGKISVVLLLAQALGQNSDKRPGIGSLFNAGLICVTLALILKQPSLSMTIILSVVSAGMMLIAGFPFWLLLAIGGLGGAAAIHKIMHTEYQMRRIQGWLDPWKDAQDTGYNVIQSILAIGSGGIFGKGLGMSAQKLYWLPFRHTDFIFSVWAEEWGLLGCIVLLGLFLTLLYRGYVIAKTCRSSFGQLLAMGITMVFAAQVVINVSVATGLFPVTGVTLPLISYGGTSVIVTLIMIGMLMSISRYRVTVSPLHQSTEL